MDTEVWRQIDEFPNYSVSDHGRIYNRRTRQFMAVSRSTFGHMKITLTDERTRDRYTRSVALLVAQAFVEPPDRLSTQPVILDGVLENVFAWNIVWRPRWFAWKYARQLRVVQPVHFHNLRVVDSVTGIRYESIVAAGTQEGLLFKDIWRSTFSGLPVYPFGSVFTIVENI